MNRSIFVVVLIILLAFLASCTNANLRKNELFAEYDGRGNANYYRLTMEADGSNGKTKYRSGWYDARAVDDLFGNIAEKSDVKSTTARRQRKAIEKTFSKYMKALEDDNKASQLESYRTRYQEALRAVSGTTSAGEGPMSTLDHADEKFVMIFANDPDAIIKAIRNRMKGYDIVGSVNSIVQGKSKIEAANNRLKLSLLAAQVNKLQTSLRASYEDLPENATNQTLIMEISSLLAEMEAVQ